jgi:NAD+ kinase
MLAKNLAKATIQLEVKAIMIVTKARDNSLIYLTREIVDYLLAKNKDITVYVDRNLQKLKRFNAVNLYETVPKAKKYVKYWDKKFALQNPQKFDLVVTLGGDGTVLYVSNLFQRVVPPVISFALGSLGFLTNFKFEQFRERMSNVLDAGVRAYLRMRFTCRVHRADGKLICEQQVLNELVVDRGPSPYVTQLELYGDGSLLTVAQADGLIIATPTGSTAYSLSAGGSLVHPGVSAISVTPICPHTLSFRPILLPDGMFLKVKVPSTSRSTAWASFDGKVRTELHKGDYVTIHASPFPFPTVISSKTEYIDSVSRNLNWNAREQQKPFTHLLSENNKKIYENSPANLDSHINNLSLAPDEFDIDYTDEENSSLSDEDIPFVPSPEEGLETPPTYGTFEDRPCFAHPNAKISLNGSSSMSNFSSPTSAESDTLTMYPKHRINNNHTPNN